jgi:hypothetical protein
MLPAPAHHRASRGPARHAPTSTRTRCFQPFACCGLLTKRVLSVEARRCEICNTPSNAPKVPERVLPIFREEGGGPGPAQPASVAGSAAAAAAPDQGARAMPTPPARVLPILQPGGMPGLELAGPPAPSLHEGMASVRAELDMLSAPRKVPNDKN